MAYKPKILIVEGDGTARRQLESTLRVMGADPRTLTDPRQAIRVVDREKFDGAFVAWDTPGINAQQVCQKIRESKSNSRMPIAILSKQEDARSIAAGFKAGATFFVSKPVGARELTRLLNASRGAMLAERRRYVRVPLAAAVACKWGGKQLTGQAVNLSVSGILLTLSPAPEMKARVEVEFSLPHGATKLRLAGDVVRLKGNQVGLQFHEPAEEQTELLRRYIDKTAGTATSLD
jgi:DNA-binding response OmpR family regulator